MLKAIHAQEDREVAREKAKLVAEKLRKMNLNKVTEFVESTIEETLSYWTSLMSVGHVCVRTRLWNGS